MGAALGAADDVVVMDVYVAREDPEPGVDGAMVASHVPLPTEHVVFAPQWDRVPGASPCLQGSAWRADGVGFRFLHPDVRSGCREALMR